MLLGCARVQERRPGPRRPGPRPRGRRLPQGPQEAASGGRRDRPELHRLLDQLRESDVVVVWELDRLSRSLKDRLPILERSKAAGAGFRSLTEAVDTTGPAGRMMTQMLGACAEFERAMIRERTRAASPPP